MSTLGLVAVVLLAVVVALFVGLGLLTRRRNGSTPAEQQPRTVADLVRLRAEEAARTVSEAPTARVVTVPVVAPEAPTVELAASDPIVAPTERLRGPIAGPSGRLAPRPAPVAPPEPAPANTPAASVEPSPAGDTPWGRAARVAGGESAFWAPEGAQGVPDEPEPPRPAAPVWVEPERAAGRSGITGADRGASDAVWTAPEDMKQQEPQRPLAVAAPFEDNSAPTPPRAFAVVPPVPAVPRPLAVVPPLPAEPVDTPDDQDGEGTEDAVVVTLPAAAPPPTPETGVPPITPEGSRPAEPAPLQPASPPFPPSRPALPPPATPPPLGPVDVVAPPAPGPDDEVDEVQEPLLAAAFSGANGTRTAMRPRRTAAETAAEQAAADLALLRTFGFSEAGGPPDGDSTMSLRAVPAVEPDDDDAARPVRFRVVGRDGGGVGAAAVALLDDRGRETATAVADADGHGELRAPHAGSYVLVSTATDHQPGAVALTVSDEPLDAEVLLARSAALAGTVFGEDGPVVGARLTLVQDGEIVDSVTSAADGSYRIADLAAGEYGLSVTAADCEPVAVLLDVPDETVLHHDVDLEPAGIPTGPGPSDDDDMAIGHR